MATLLQDLRYALRTLRKSRGFTVVAVVTLALGIGATTGIFSVVNGVLLTPLPYQEPDELVMLWESNPAEGYFENVVSPANYFDWREQTTAFEGLGALADFDATLTGVGEPERIGLVQASASFFPLLGVAASVGRTYTAAEDVAGGPPVAVLSHAFWQRQFGGDPAVVGQTLTLDGEGVVVVGVLPEGFRFDLPQEILGSGSPEMWVPLHGNAGDREWRGRFLQVVGRLKPGVSVAEAQAQMSTLAGRLEQAYPESQTGWDVNVVPLHQQVVGDVQEALILILGAVAFVLLIACANVANLLLAGAAARQQEISIRTALGAARHRLVRQLLTESLLLGVAGGLLGLFLAWVGVRAMVAAAPDIPRLDQIGVDATILAFTFGLSLLTGLLFGLLPAARASRAELGAALREGDARAGAGRRPRRTRGGLAVAEIGLSLMLLVGAGLLIRSFANLVDVDIGFETDRLLTASLQPPNSSYTSTERVQFFDELVGRVRSLPGVDAASAITFPPLVPGNARQIFWANDRPVPGPGEAPAADIRWVHADYHRTLGIPLLEGRLFDRRDNADAPLRVVASRAVAEQLWPGESAIGKQLSMPWGDTLVAEIIGVVGDVHHVGPNVEPYPTLYWDHRQFRNFPFMTLVVRTAGDPLDLASGLRAQVRAMDPDLPAASIRTMRSYLSDALARARFATTALGLFALVALVLASVGIYGVLSYNVGRRTREFGVRISLGASGHDVVRLVLGQALRLVGLALVVGAAGALWLSDLMQGLVFGVGTNDPLTFAAAALFLAGAALLACWIPARRAARVSPMAVLREE